MGCGAGEKAVGRDPSAFAPRAQLKIPHLARSLAALWAPAGQPSQGNELTGPCKSPARDACTTGAQLCSTRFLGLVHGVLLISVRVKL